MASKAPSEATRTAFIAANANQDTPPLTPEIKLFLATEATDLWEATEDFLEKEGLPPPFWAFAWAGGQALARYVLDNPECVRGKRVLDYGSGSGLVSIAALKVGAESAVAADLDPFASAASALNGALNGVAPTSYIGDATALDPSEFAVILAADVCYDRTQADPTTVWLRAAAAAGVAVYMGDPGRMYLPDDGLTLLGDYDVPTSMALEQYPITPSRVWRLNMGAARKS